MTKISIILLASWALLFGVDILGVHLVNIPRVHGSPLKKTIVNSIVSSSPLASGKSLRGHSIKARQVSYDYEEDPIDSSGGLGAIGCKFSKTLCDSKLEWCFDDYAFGRCLKIYEPPDPSKLYRHDLNREDTHALEREMERLYGLGYRWSHTYTQCILQNMLDAIRRGTSWDTSVCADAVDQDLEGAMKAFQDEVDPMSLAFVKFTPSQSNPHPEFADELYLPPAPIETSAPASPQVLQPAQDYLNNNANKATTLDKLKSIPPRQDMNEIPQDIEELLVEDAIAEYLARMGQKLDRTNKRAYPYYTARPSMDEVNPFVIDERQQLTEAEAEAFVKALVDAVEEEGILPEVPQAQVEQEELKALQDVLKPKIFSPVYNTPHLFRHGIETKDELDEELPEIGEDVVEGSLGDVQISLPLEDEEPNAGVWDEKPVEPIYLTRDDLESLVDESVEEEKSKPLYTEGGLVYLNNPQRRFFVDDASRGGRRSSGFERHERLDVKKPGPWYRTVNNFAFDYDEKKNPEFTGNEGPADMQVTADLTDSDDEDLVRKPKSSNQPAPAQSETANGAEIVSAYKKSSLMTDHPVHPIDDHLQVLDTSQFSVIVDQELTDLQVKALQGAIVDALRIKPSALTVVNVDGKEITFRVGENDQMLNASAVAQRLVQESVKNEVQTESGTRILSANGITASLADDSSQLIFRIFVVSLAVVTFVVAAVTIYVIRRQAKQQEKIARLTNDDPGNESCKDYQDLCRARMASKNNEKVEPIKAVQRVASTMSKGSEDGNLSSRSSTSSWSDEPVLTNMDISTGHMVLSYMEDHLKNKDRLDQEWAALCAYEADTCSTAIAEKPDNQKKNRYTNSLPFDHSRVILNDLANVSGTDYINASTITDHDPRNPAYIATQGPLANTCADFWQMVWEQGSVVIVTLTKLADNGTSLCHRYWPEEGSELHHIYEVHLVSEHIWCDEYLVRSFYLKNLKTGETRTVTQFHFLAWPENNIPASTKALLEFRRKVNKSYRGRSCPIIVHCSDGAGRTGTYCLIDMVLNRMAKGAKEIDIAASLEHIRDQRPGMVRTKQQFEFVLMAVAEEVHAILKALPQ